MFGNEKHNMTILHQFWSLCATAYHISRSRFWLYLGGTYAVGAAWSVPHISDLYSPFYLLHLLYFLTVANLMLYGINDLYDRDTDATNPKKGAYEHKLRKNDERKTRYLVWTSVLIGALVLLMQPLLLAKLIMGLFIFLSLAYSMPPLRLKARPILDALSNGLYILPAILACVQFTDALPPVFIILAAWCWTTAMHLFSAIGDIAADTQARLSTSAVIFGQRLSLFVCAILWAVSVMLVFTTQLFPFVVIGIVYPLIPLLLLRKDREVIMQWYWRFPVITGIIGGILFWLGILLR